MDESTLVATAISQLTAAANHVLRRCCDSRWDATS